MPESESSSEPTLSLRRTQKKSRAGTTFGKYRIGDLLGRGGMGEVYEAFDTEKNRTVALKILSTAGPDDDDYRRRFAREANAAAGLQEPHVIPIHDWGEIDGALYIDMRLVKGTNLLDVLSRGPLEPARAVKICTEIASALDAAHAEQLVHRDIKPANIILTANDFAYLLDFGIAERAGDTPLTRAGLTIGSMAYMAPERLNGHKATPAVDVYGLTCVLFECLTGRAPFTAPTMAEVMTGHLHSPPPRPSATVAGLPSGLDEVIARGMAKDPQQRYPSAGALAAAAARALGSAGQQAAPSAAPVPPQQYSPAQPQYNPAQPQYNPAPQQQFAAPAQTYGQAQPAPGQTYGQAQPAQTYGQAQPPTPPAYAQQQPGWGPGGPGFNQPAPAGRDRKPLLILVGVGVIVLIIAIIVGFVMIKGGSGSKKATSAGDAVKLYLEALAKNDAKTALSYSIDQPSSRDLLTNEILKKQTEKWPITEIKILGDNATAGFGRVHVSARFGDQVSDEEISVKKVDNQWKLEHGAIKLDTSKSISNDKAMKTLTVFDKKLSEGPAYVFPGWIEFGSDNANLAVEPSKPMLLNALSSLGMYGSEFTFKLSDKGNQAVKAAIDAKLASCTSSNELRPAGCPQSVFKYDLVDGTAVWGTPDTSGLTIDQPSSYDLESRISGELVFPLSARTRSGDTWQGTDTEHVYGKADLTQDPPTVSLR